MRRHLPLTLLLLSFTACHPLACFFPPELPRDPPYQLTSKDKWPRKKVEVRVDDRGIPHLSGQSDNDLGYALGVMHGRDRAFQIMLYRHASQGRLTELLGEDFLEVDRQNRLLTYRADEQLETMGEDDRALVDAYVAGVNEGASWAGKSAEMFLLGVEWSNLSAYDVVCITRLQQWGQAVGFNEEMNRYRLVKTLGLDDARVQEILQDAPSGGVPIVPEDEHDGELPDVNAAHAPSSVLANDPHLSHTGPGIFYMVHMEGPDFTVAGGTFPGIPGVLIGHGRDIAWGVTNAYADTQDVVVLEPAADDDDLYIVDGTPMAYTRQKQCFKLGHDKDSEKVCESYRYSIFGPVLPDGYGSYDGARPLVDGKERLALLWTAWEYPEDNGRLYTAFLRLARSKDVQDATDALQDFAAPAMSVLMAFTDGTIAYRLSGIVPVRGDEQRVDFPRRGSSRSAGWFGRVPAAQKPQTTNPDKGYIVAANQRVVENDVLTQRFVGFEEAKPWRAMRITDRIKKLIDDGKPSTEALLSIQQDAVSLESKKLADILGAHCPKTVAGHSDNVTQAFCKAIADFDGDYSVDSTAVPYVQTWREFQRVVFEAMVDDELALDLTDDAWAVMALIELTEQAHKGDSKPAIFNDPRHAGREGLSGFVARAVKRALDLVAKEQGESEGDWRWGKSHTKSVRGALAEAPAVGFLFDGWSREEGGYPSAPRAEAPNASRALKVRFGAGLRLIAELKKDGADVRMVNDSGQSGHFGHRHIEDQQDEWSAGAPFALAMSKKQVGAVLEGALDVLPRK